MEILDCKSIIAQGFLCLVSLFQRHTAQDALYTVSDKCILYFRGISGFHAWGHETWFGGFCGSSALGAFMEPPILGYFWERCTLGLFPSASPFCFLGAIYDFALFWNVTTPIMFGMICHRDLQECIAICFFKESCTFDFWEACSIWVFLGVLYHLYFYEFCMLGLFLACFTIPGFSGSPLWFWCFLECYNNQHVWKASPCHPRREYHCLVFWGSPAPFGCLGVLHHLLFYKLCTSGIFLSPPCTGIFGALYSGALGELCSFGLFHHTSPSGYLRVLHSRLFQSLPLLDGFLIISPWGFLRPLHSGFVVVFFFCSASLFCFFGNPLWFHCFRECYYTRHFLNASLHLKKHLD